MSRRKQEKPQPRKNLVKGEAVELAQDILTCGVCQRDFPLCEIVRFIQHKVNTCNKENSCITKLFSVPPDDSDSEDVLSTLPSSAKHRQEKQSDVSSSSATLKPTTGQTAKENSPKDAPPEPCSYICSTCKEPYATAWTLLQHVQNHHGLKIYVDAGQHPPEQMEKSGSTPDHNPPSIASLRAPLLERQLDTTSRLFPRSSSQELRLDLLGLSSSSNHLPGVQSSPPPLIEVHHLDSTSRASSVGLSCEPQLDFYSQRLRELAGATSPNALISSSAKLLQPNFKAVVNDKPNTPPSSTSECSKMPQVTNVASTAPAATKTPPQMPQTSASSTTSENQPASPKANPKSCEFCGKSFRFMSNLIVHRRSHTGEKPFKCHICNHACTQASKLKRHMKTHKVDQKCSSDDKPLALDASSSRNGLQGSDEAEDSKQHGSQANGEGEYASDDQAGGNQHQEEEDEYDEEIDVEDEDDEEEEVTGDHGSDERKGRDVMMAEDLSKKTVRNGSSENNSSTKPDKKDSNNTIKHSLLSEVMEKIGLASIQQYTEAYKQALKESAIIKQERYSDGSISNDGANHHVERPPREGARSAGQSPLNFNNSTSVLSAFDQSVTPVHKRIKVEEPWRENDENSLYAGVWIPTISSVSSYKDLYSADGSDRRKSKTEKSALNNSSPTGRGSASPRPGPSASLSNLGSITNSLSKPKEQRRNDTCEFCGKVFKNCSNLTVHRRSHTGEKPYKCELCSYACAQSSKLTRHMKTHGRMGKDVYRCRFCDMPFSVPSTLEKHMRKCVVSQSTVGSSYIIPERDSDLKEITSS